MSSGIGEFLKDKVYPDLDAVDAGLLDHLKPHGQSNGSYQLTCPSCGEKRAFYYIGSAFIQCNRRNQCKVPTSLWDVLSQQGLSNSDIIKRLCSAAGVTPPPPPRRSNSAGARHPQAPTNTATPLLSPGKAIIRVTQELAVANPGVLSQLQAARGYSDSEMATMRFGVYTTAGEVLSRLESLGISKEVAQTKGYIGYDDANPDHLWDVMDGRVVGYWPHDDGDVRLWGRIPAGSGSSTTKKYRFSKSLIKDIPYLFTKRQGAFPICVEGVLDAWSLQLLGYWGNAIGQAAINPAQALYMASKGVTEAAHMVDGDGAGYDGALASIRSCEPVGITLSIIVLGAGLDDADAMRRNGKDQQLRELIDARMNAGTYLAHYCASLLSQPAPDTRALARVRSIAAQLTPVSKRCWEDYARSLGVYVDDEVESVRVLGSLVNAGLPLSESLALVKRRTGYTITIQKEEQALG